LSIFDLFEKEGNSVNVVNPSRKAASSQKKATNNIQRSGRQTDLFSGGIQQPSPPASKTTANDKPTIPDTITRPAPYSGELQPFHRNDCLAVDNSRVGHLQDVDKAEAKAIFHPLQLSPLQKARAEAYVAVRDAYHDLYQKEAEKQVEYDEERQALNRLYDDFVKRYGNLNSAENTKLIKTDSAGKEMPYLEREQGGVIHKADIFSRPVSFSTATIATDNPGEALAASLNKYGKVDLDYMSRISSSTADALKEAL